jgi:hypothetical protein
MNEWIPPEELTKPTPRKVVVKRRWKLYILFVLIPIVVAYCIFSPLREKYRRMVLDESGLTTDTKIDSFQRSRNRIIMGACYTFSHDPYDHPQKYDTRTMTLACDRIDTTKAKETLHVGSPIKVLYVEGFPAISEIVGLHLVIPGERFVFTMPLAFFLLACLNFIYRAQIGPQKLYEFGQPAAASVLATRDRGLWLTTSYKFIDSSGKEIVGKNLVRKFGRPRAAQGPSYHPLSNPTVLYDPKDSRRHMLYDRDYVFVQIA